ncbi:hypothetical protein RHSIM_Rhsim02G0014000 [Rhododendron simsii]|uniref:MSP domain-containing protein n=1 Tax=Rhododendron simsii TaxID=118357 RepID=A0A834LTU1_RHOSS|nr:hypothetical protein RHSIM_Rhsim02G0014000 [Rhododendron simsii]
MTTLLDIQPRELKFTFESKKQCSCAIQLINTSDHYVAFKVKTTSPKKYCVRPNTGVVKPKSKCDFTVTRSSSVLDDAVTMQAQQSAPSDLQCRDKFLVQSTVVPFGTTEDDITSGMFAKDSGKHIEDSKLRVVLISPPQSPVLLQSNGVTKQELPHETSGQIDKLWTGVENLPPPMFRKDVDDVKSAPVMEEPRLLKDVVDFSPSKGAEPRPVKDIEGTALKLGKDIEELKSKLNVLESKLSEAGFTIKRLTEERSTDIQEKKTLKKELVLLRKNFVGGRPVQVGFPLLFVCMVALVSLVLGYLLPCLSLQVPWLEILEQTEQYAVLSSGKFTDDIDVTTTSPKKYCVRPNNGVFEPKAKCDFKVTHSSSFSDDAVTMQAQQSAPSDLQCRDKFLVQSTVVPLWTTKDDITGIFAKDNGKHIEESKLRVVLISPPRSRVLLPSNGVTKQELPYETSGQKDKLCTGVENLPPPMAAFTIKKFTEERSNLLVGFPVNIGQARTGVAQEPDSAMLAFVAVQRFISLLNSSFIAAILGR